MSGGVWFALWLLPAVILRPAPAAAQTGTVPAAVAPAVVPAPTRHHWQFEFHGGVASAPSVVGGISELGSVTQTDNAKNTVPSWFFGTGAGRIHDVFTAHGVTAPAASLDPILSASALDRAATGGIGGRAAVSMTHRLTLEFAVDVTSLRGLSADTLADIETTRSAFQTGLAAVLASISPADRARELDNMNELLLNDFPAVVLSPVVTATDAIHAGAGTAVLTSVDVCIGLGSIKSFAPYALIGAGISKAVGAGPTVSLTGDYAFDLALPTGNAPIHETDQVTLEWLRPIEVVTVAGGGVERAIGRRTGLRAEVRVVSGPVGDSVALTANPVFATAAPAGGLYLVTTGAALNPVVLANVVPASLLSATTSQSVKAMFVRTLSGPAVSAFPAMFDSRGWQHQVDVTIGYYVRF